MQEGINGRESKDQILQLYMGRFVGKDESFDFWLAKFGSF